MSARLRNLNPYELHKYLVNIYCLNTKGSVRSLKRDTSRDRTDLDIIRENHKFVWEDDDVADTWEKQLAKKYCDKLFKEYCICDLSRYKENKMGRNKEQKKQVEAPNQPSCACHSYAVALRWRIEKEVVLGKGQFQCGNKVCNNDDGLKSWEVNFAYMEDNEKKNALVKLRLCPGCSELLNYRSKKREIKRLKRSRNKSKKVKKPDKDESEDEDKQCPGTPEDPMEPSTSAEAVSSATETSEASMWKKGLQETEEKSREEEFEEYLEDLLL